MTLPDWSIQLAYSRIGWAIIIAAILLSIGARWHGRHRALPRLAIALVVMACVVISLVPGKFGLGYWLLLALQWPSALLVALAGCSCWRRWNAAAATAGAPLSRLLPLSWAVTIVVAGSLLYVDVSGWLAWGLYPAGFGPMLAPALALVLSLRCLVAIARAQSPERALVLLAALAAYSIGRLPSGNLWDAMFDPLLWLWSVASVIGSVWRQWRPLMTADMTDANKGFKPA